MKKRKELPLPPADKPMLSVVEACAVSGLGESTIRDLCKKRKLKHIRINRRMIIRRVDLMAMMDPDRAPDLQDDAAE